MSMIQIVTNSEHETQDLGRRIGELLLPGTVVALDGTLGSGKTRLTQGIGIGLGVAPDSIVSPTYTLCVPYSGRLDLIHLDAYRIKDLAEVDELGLDELVEEGAILVVEWAARIAKCLPRIDLSVFIQHSDDDRRTIRLETQTRQVEFLDQLESNNNGRRED